jgi:hypothetical protein
VDRKNVVGARGAACSDDFGVHVVLGENTDHVDTVRADGRTRLMKMIIFIVALAFAVSAGVATVMSIYLHQSEACQGNNC